MNYKGEIEIRSNGNDSNWLKSWDSCGIEDDDGAGSGVMEIMTLPHNSVSANKCRDWTSITKCQSAARIQNYLEVWSIMCMYSYLLTLNKSFMTNWWRYNSVRAQTRILLSCSPHAWTSLFHFQTLTALTVTTNIGFCQSNLTSYRGRRGSDGGSEEVRGGCVSGSPQNQTGPRLKVKGSRFKRVTGTWIQVAAGRAGDTRLCGRGGFEPGGHLLATYISGWGEVVAQLTAVRRRKDVSHILSLYHPACPAQDRQQTADDQPLSIYLHLICT